MTYTGEDQKALMRRFYDIWQSGNVDAIDQIVDVNYVGHVATGDRDRNGLKDRIAAFRAAMPGAVITVDTQIAEGDLVCTRLTAHGTHAETGMATSLMGLNLSRIRDSKIVEEWTAWETVDVVVPDLDEWEEE